MAWVKKDYLLFGAAAVVAYFLSKKVDAAEEKTAQVDFKINEPARVLLGNQDAALSGSAAFETAGLHVAATNVQAI
jgi:hypothetical protein